MPWGAAKVFQCMSWFRDCLAMVWNHQELHFPISSVLTWLFSAKHYCLSNVLKGSQQTIHAAIVLALLTCLCVCCAVSSSLTWPPCQHWPSTQQAACTATQASTKRGMHPSCRLRSSTTSRAKQVCSAAVCACDRHIPAVRLSDNPNIAPAVSPPSSLTHSPCQSMACPRSH